MTIVQILVAVASGLLINELGEWCPWMADRLVRWSARCRYRDDPERAAIRGEEQAAVVKDRPGKLFKLFTALGFAASAVVTQLASLHRPIRRLLLPAEHVVIEVRRHWAILTAETMQTVAMLLGLLALRTFGRISLLTLGATVTVSLVVLRWLWIVCAWWMTRLLVTDKRVLLVTGRFHRRVFTMPLIKIVDLACKRSRTGRLLGYGEFVLESAGNDQALSRITFLPAPDAVYLQMEKLLSVDNT